MAQGQARMQTGKIEGVWMIRKGPDARGSDDSMICLVYYRPLPHLELVMIHLAWWGLLCSYLGNEPI